MLHKEEKSNQGSMECI